MIAVGDVLETANELIDDLKTRKSELGDRGKNLDMLARLCDANRSLQSAIGQRFGEFGMAELLSDLSDDNQNVRCNAAALIASLTSSNVPNQALLVSQSYQIAVGTTLVLNIPKIMKQEFKQKKRQWHQLQGHRVPHGEAPLSYGNNNTSSCYCNLCAGKKVNRAIWKSHYRNLNLWLNTQDTDSLSLVDFVQEKLKGAVISNADFGLIWLSSDINSNTTTLDPKTNVCGIKLHIRLVVSLSPKTLSTFTRRKRIIKTVRNYFKSVNGRYLVVDVLNHEFFQELWGVTRHHFSSFVNNVSSVSIQDILRYDTFDNDNSNDHNIITHTKDPIAQLGDIVLYENPKFRINVCEVTKYDHGDENDECSRCLTEIVDFVSKSQTSFSVIECRMRIMASTSEQKLRIEVLPKQNQCRNLDIPLFTQFAAQIPKSHLQTTTNNNTHFLMLAIDHESLETIASKCMILVNSIVSTVMIAGGRIPLTSNDSMTMAGDDTNEENDDPNGLSKEVETLLTRVVKSRSVTTEDLKTVLELAIEKCNARLERKSSSKSSSSLVKRAAGRDRCRICRDLLLESIKLLTSNNGANSTIIPRVKKQLGLVLSQSKAESSTAKCYYSLPEKPVNSKYMQSKLLRKHLEASKQRIQQNNNVL